MSKLASLWHVAPIATCAGVSETRRSHKVEIDTPANTVHTRMAPAFSETKGRKKICCRSENNVVSQVRTQKFWLWKWLNMRKTSRKTHDSSHMMPPAFEPLESSRQQTCQITGWQMIGTFLLQRVLLLVSCQMSEEPKKTTLDPWGVLGFSSHGAMWWHDVHMFS